jgi:hypothetical protein
MADDPQAAVKDAPAGAAKGGKLPGMLGPAAAVAVLLAVGIGIGVYAASLLKGVKAGGEAEAKVEAKHETGPSLESLHEIALPDLISNVRNQQGRRYIKVSCAVWLTKADAIKLGFMGGGEGGKGGGGEVKKIIQMNLEEHLKGYDLDELTGPNIYVQLKKGFQDQAEKALRDLFPEFPPDHRFVQKVVLTNLLVQ